MRRLAFSMILATSLTHAPTATMAWRPPNTAHIGCENEKGLSEEVLSVAEEFSSVASWKSRTSIGVVTGETPVVPIQPGGWSGGWG